MRPVPAGEGEGEDARCPGLGVESYPDVVEGECLADESPLLLGVNDERDPGVCVAALLPLERAKSDAAREEGVAGVAGVA